MKGNNEPIQFTRGDSDRLTRIEENVQYLTTQIESALGLKHKVDKNSAWIVVYRWSIITIIGGLVGIIIKII